MSPVRPTVPEEESTVAAVPGIWSYEALDNNKVKWYYLRTPLSLKGILSACKLPLAPMCSWELAGC